MEQFPWASIFLLVVALLLNRFITSFVRTDHFERRIADLREQSRKDFLEELRIRNLL